MTKSYRIAVVSMLLAVLAACGSATVTVNPKAVFPLPVTDEAPAVLFPINIDYTGAPVESRKNGPVIASSIVRQFGKKMISAGQLFDAAGNLTFEFPEAIDASVRQGGFRISAERQRIVVSLDAFVRRMTGVLAAQRLVPKNFSVTHIVVFHTRGRQVHPGSVALDSLGAVFNVATGDIVSYTRIPASVQTSTAEVVSKLTEIYSKMAGDLLSGKGDRR